MGRHELRLRENWQAASGRLSSISERTFHELFTGVFRGTSYSITRHPKELSHVYENWPLQSRDAAEIYDPQRPYSHGFQPDFRIKNSETTKSIYVELKRQDGWVEGKSRSAGRGNAHERLCKYFTPGLMKILRQESGIQNGLPFWIVFAGDITRDPCRTREITCWFDEHAVHFFFWRDKSTTDPVSHFITHIAPLLD